MKHLTKTIIATSLLAFAVQSYAIVSPSADLTSKNNGNNINVTPAERAKIENVVHQYLLSNPEVLMESLQVLQRKQYEEAEQTVKKTQQIAATFANALFHQPNDPIAGNPQGKVTVVEFFDYQCPHCVDMAPIMTAIVQKNPDLRVVYKEFPIRGPMSEFAARAALAANQQGKYIPFSHGLLAANQPLTKELVMQIAKNNGLDINELNKDMEGKLVKDQLQANLKLAQDLKLFGTPALFIGKTNASGNSPINYIPGQLDQNQLQNEIDKVGG